jgi:DNA-binding CsgD family transcriptional regulator
MVQFVGREQELGELRAAFDAAAANAGSLRVVVGEPGIGKTAICERLDAYAAEHGGRTLVGHCYEEGSFSLPYLPFVEAIRAYVLDSDVDALRADLGSRGGEVARIVPELRDRLGLDPPREPGTFNEEDRYRLLQAATEFLRTVAIRQPLVLVLEDMHDADRGTLDLMVHLSRQLAGSRLLVVGTYRDMEVDRSHPLSAVLAELRRNSHFSRVLLRGLSIEQVQRLLASMGVTAAGRALAEAVHRQTEGNPLFVQEVARYVTEEGQLPYVPGETLIDRIPEGLRDVIGKRLSRLSERTNHVLSVASVIGRDFRLDVLQQVAEISPEDVIQSLAEAHARVIIEEREAASGSLVFRFSHALFRQTLYEEIFAAWRIRWHQQIAAALEKVHAGRLEEHAAELAEHFAHSVDPVDLTRAVEYGQLAAAQAMRVFAYGEAERLLGQALRAQRVLAPTDYALRCDLLLALGESILPTEQPQRVAETIAEQAFELAHAAGDSERATRAVMQALEALKRSGAAREVTEQWLERGRQTVASGTAEQVRLETYEGLNVVAVEPARGVFHLRRALQLGEELGDEQALAFASGYAIHQLYGVRDVERMERLARDFITERRGSMRTADLAFSLVACGGVLLGGGHREDAEAASRELAGLAERTQDVLVQAAAGSARGWLAFLDGRLEDAVSVDSSTMLPGISPSIGAAAWRARVLAYLGRLDEVRLAAVQNRFPTRTGLVLRALVLALSGHCDEIPSIRAYFGDVGSEHDESGVHVLLVLLEACTGCGDEVTVTALLGRLAPLADRLQHQTMVAYGRVLGEAARMLGKREQARDFYLRGLVVCEKVRFRPERAIIQLDLAELLAFDFPHQRADAIAYLNLAIPAFEAMKMHSYLERARRLGQRIGRVDFVPSAAMTTTDALTRREREVAALLGTGKTNREIADALTISESTAEVHVKHILSKLGLRSRAQAAVWAAEHGAVAPSS